MLDLMRRKKRLKAILWIVIFSLALGMLLFFVPGINMGDVTTDTSAATVDGQAIPMKDFALAYRNMIKRYSNNGRNKTDAETLKAMGVPKQVLDDLITAKVLQVVANRMGVEITPAEVRHAIETYPYLQDQNQFIGIERYKALLAANDIPVEEFEADVKRAELAKKVREIITDSLDVSDSQLRDEFSKENQQTQIVFAILKKDEFKKRIQPTEAELRAYFDAHKADYQIKEKRQAQYLLVPMSQLLTDVNVTDQEIQDEWNKEPHDETVTVAHILLKVDDPSKDAEVKAKAEEILKQLKNGADFAALAKKYSQDPGSAKEGGVLPPFTRGQMVKEFEDAAFSLKPGETSGLVHTQYGYHIIRVLKHETPTLEANRASIMMNIRMRKAQALAKQKAEEAEKIALKTKDLNAAAKSVGSPAEVKETNYFQKDDTAYDLGFSPAFRDEVFKLKEINSIGKVVEHPLGYAIPKLIGVQLPKPGDFAQSKPQVERDYVDAKAKEMMKAEAQKLSETARTQGGLEKAAKEMGLVAKTSQMFTLAGTPDPEIGSNSELNKVAFALQPGDVSTPVPLLDNLVVFQVKSRSPFDEAAFQKQKAELKARLLQSSQDAFFQDYIRKVTEDLEKDGKIRINPKALEQVPSSYY